jgi:geranylgeranyl pyrophosphate synthase
MWLSDYQKEINLAIDDFFSHRYGETSWIEHDFELALRYAVEWWGKRIRPILALIAYEYFAQKYNENISLSRKDLLTCIIGLELIHCFTLVHDDLPCMDNDLLRRWKPTVWKVYGETMAVLVGDTLQTMGFECLATSGHAQIVVEIARALGDLGVARGQVRDTLLLQKDLTLNDLMRLHDEKTGVFIANSLVIWGILGRASESDIEDLRRFGMLFGRAFQIQDDILDFEWDAELLGKKAGKDVELGKWIVASIGIDESKKVLINIENELKGLLGKFNNKKFDDIREFIIKRAS